jgi:hypothetical protein
LSKTEPSKTCHDGGLPARSWRNLQQDTLEKSATGHAIGIDVEADHGSRTQTVSRVRKQPASASDIEETFSREIRDFQEAGQRLLSDGNPFFVQTCQKSLPVPSERKGEVFLHRLRVFSRVRSRRIANPLYQEIPDSEARISRKGPGRNLRGNQRVAVRTCREGDSTGGSEGGGDSPRGKNEHGSLPR